MKMKQMSGSSKKIQKELEGVERIFSRKDTKELFRLAKLADSDIGLKNLGKALYDMVKVHEEKPPEFI
jgi:hypothetical protein